MAFGFNFQELARENGLATATSSEDGGAKGVYQLWGGADETTFIAPRSVSMFATHLCGGVDSVEPKVTDPASDPHAGKIRRRLPKLHPFMPELSVSGVLNIVGTGNQGEGVSVGIVDIPSITDDFVHYTQYDFQVEFRRRPYFLLPDTRILQDRRTYTRQDGTDVDYYYAREWDRFTVPTMHPMPDTVNATTGGMMRFRTLGGLDGTQFPGSTWVYMQNQMLEVTWLMVPYRYFFKIGSVRSYLTRFVNTVNQYEFMGYEPGQLLFLGGTPTPYMPQATNIVRLFNIGLEQSHSLLCNVKMRWLATSRETFDAPLPGTKGLANKNNIAGGHNLLPSFTDRKFHYVTTEDPANPADTTKWFASFPSFPHELFFTDPMAKQLGDI